MKINNENFIKRLGEYNSKQVLNSTYNHSKLLEECLELSEVLVKMINKHKDKQPSKEKLVEELGDVLFRAEILIIKEGLHEDIQTRVNEKVAQLKPYMENKTYSAI